jgi:hypothetical protein
MDYCHELALFFLSYFVIIVKTVFFVKDAHGDRAKLDSFNLISGQNDDVARLSERCLDPETESSTESR